MSRLPSYLWRNRLGIFYVRLLVPQDILELAPKLPADIRRSLHTRDASLALRQALPLAANWHRFVDDMRAMKKPAVEPSQLLLEDSAGRQWKLSRQPGESEEDYAIAVESAVRGLTVDDIVETCNTPPARRNFAIEETAPRKAARSEKLDAWFFDVSMEYGKSQIKLGKFKEASWIKSQEPALRLFRELASVETRQVQWEGKTIEIEDLRCGDITVDMLRKYLEDLNALPAHAGQSNRIARATNPFAPCFKAALRNEAGKPPASPVTIGNKLDFLSAFLTWADDYDYLVDGKKLRRVLTNGKGRPTSDGYYSFEPEDIRLLFSSAEFRKAKEPWQYWIPVFGLFTAGRINEIAQLQVNDFGDHQGHFCVCFTDEDTHAEELPKGKKAASNRKGLKTAASKRYIPLHETLLDLGLKEFLEECKATSPDGRLFPTLAYEKEHGYARAPSNYFGKLTRAVGIAEDSRKKVFHSFRSTLNILADEYLLNDEQRRLLLGHSRKGVNERNYLGENRPITQIVEFIKQLKFDVHIPDFKSVKYGYALGEGERIPLPPGFGED